MIKSGSFHGWVVAPIVRLLTQGVTPEKIALSLAVGIVLGVFPVLGSTTLLCAAAALLFQLNLPAIQLVNYLIYPVQLALLVPFLRLGEKMFGVTHLEISLTQILHLIRTDAGRAVAMLWRAEVHAMAAWLLIGLPAIFLIHFFLSRALRQLATSSDRRAIRSIEAGLP